MKKIGKLIVIDGSDGSGKTTQATMIVKRLRRDGHAVRTMHFPQYQVNLIGTLIEECIAGEHGDFLHSDPHIASVLYAADRFESKVKIEKWLNEGAIVVLDRYVSANQIHQGGKIKDAQKRKAFLKWLDKLEYGVFKLPRPNLTIFLHVPTPVSRKLIDDRNEVKVKAGKVERRDTLEDDYSYLENAEQSALLLLKSQKHWKRVECAKDGILQTIENIHEKVYNFCRTTSD